MKLDGMHHITMITGDAQKNVDFYAGLLGLRLVKKTVNFDAPSAYHLYFGDEQGSPGSILTWFEFAGAPAGSPGYGDIHLIQLGVPSGEALDFWATRIPGAERAGETVRFADYDGLRFELVIADAGNPPLQAAHPEVPAEFAITGVEGARAYGSPGGDHALLTEALGFTPMRAGEYRLEGDTRGFDWGYDLPPAGTRGRQGAGTVHHIAWASQDEDHLRWQTRVREARVPVTGVRDRDYFESIYFRVPEGVLFEIATLSPGFAVDEDLEHLGEGLRLPKQHEHLRGRLEEILQPVANPRAVRA